MDEHCNCGNCKYWKKVEGKIGECHRYAPMPIMSKEPELVKWPQTNSAEFCGEFAHQGKTKVEG